MLMTWRLTDIVSESLDCNPAPRPRLRTQKHPTVRSTADLGAVQNVKRAKGCRICRWGRGHATIVIGARTTFQKPVLDQRFILQATLCERCLVVFIFLRGI